MTFDLKTLRLKERILKDFNNQKKPDRKISETDYRDFCSFLQEALTREFIVDKEAIRIANLFLAKGPESVLDREWTHFSKHLHEECYAENCSICGEDLSWSFLEKEIGEDLYCEEHPDELKSLQSWED